MYLKIIACEIALREICFAAARSPSTVDLEFLPQGYHDYPTTGVKYIQERISAVPPGKYDAILLGYGLCGNIIKGIQAQNTKIVIPRAHDCITFFLGSHRRYMEVSQERPGTYYYTAGWLEVLRRRGDATPVEAAGFLPTRAAAESALNSTYAQWVEKFGKEKADYLASVMDQWSSAYSRGVLIEFDFNRVEELRERVRKICERHGWEFESLQGDMGLLQAWVDGEWDAERFLVLNPGEIVEPSYGSEVIAARNPVEKQPATESR